MRERGEGENTQPLGSASLLVFDRKIYSQAPRVALLYLLALLHEAHDEAHGGSLGI